MEGEAALDPFLSSLLCCPDCKGDSRLLKVEGKKALQCDQCQKNYPLKEVPGPEGKGILIPDLLIADSE